MTTPNTYFRVVLADGYDTCVLAPSRAKAYIAATSRYAANERPLSRSITPIAGPLVRPTVNA